MDRGYLVPSHGNTFEFYEVPQPRAAVNSKNEAAPRENELTGAADENLRAVSNVDPQSREINNTATLTNKETNNEVESGEVGVAVPRVKEVVISRPTATGKKRPPVREEPKAKEFEF